jgi:hypothetical protein
MRSRALLPLAALSAALALSACGGSGSQAASRASPPSPITLSALVGPRGLSVSPTRLGAGPVLLTATNQGRRAVMLTVARRGRAGGGTTLARTGAIDPQDVTQLKIDLDRGTYVVTAGGPRPRTDAARSRAARGPSVLLRVGRPRASSGGGLPQP